MSFVCSQADTWLSEMRNILLRLHGEDSFQTLVRITREERNYIKWVNTLSNMLYVISKNLLNYKQFIILYFSALTITTVVENAHFQILLTKYHV